MSQSKIKITQKDFDDIYEIEEGITEETIQKDAQSEVKNTTPKFEYTEEEEAEDNRLEETLNWNEEEDK